MQKYIIVFGSIFLGRMQVEAGSHEEAADQANKLLENNDPMEFIGKLSDKGMGGVIGIISEDGNFYMNPMMKDMGRVVAEVATDKKVIDGLSLPREMKKTDEKATDDKFNPLDPLTWRQ